MFLRIFGVSLKSLRLIFLHLLLKANILKYSAKELESCHFFLNKDIQKRATFRFMFECFHIFRSNIIFYHFARDCENRFKLKRTFSSKPSKHIWTNLPCIGIGVNCNLHKICEIYEICKVAR